MKSILRIAAMGAALGTLGVSSAASAATETAEARAQILAALSVELDTTANALDFGNVAESGSGGTVTLTSANARTCSVGLLCTGTTLVPEFDITGAADAPVAISFTSNTITLDGPSGAQMDVDLTASEDNLDLTGGVGSFTVGGVLTVAAGQAAGAYTGELEVVVLYN